MDINRVIKHLKANVPELGRRVGGAAEHERASENGYLEVPAAYVIPMADDAEPNADQNGLWQEVTESVGIILVLDNTADRRGQAAAAAVEALKYAVHKALLNWRPDPSRVARGLAYDGGSLVGADGSRLVWQLVYSQTAVLTEADGYPLDGVPLLAIDGYGPDGGDDERYRFQQVLEQEDGSTPGPLPLEGSPALGGGGGGAVTGVSSVNGQEGAVTLTAGDVGAQPASPTLAAFAGFSGTGLVRAAPDTFVPQPVGADDDADILDRAAADGRYLRQTTAAEQPIPTFVGDRCGVMVPLYFYPNNSYWDAAMQRLLGLIRRYHSVPTMVIVNAGQSPSGKPGGPGLVWDGNHAAAIRLLKAAGAIVVGYVSTDYAQQTFEQVKGDVDGWDLYSDTPIDGIFMDEMPWDLGAGNANVALYEQHYSYIRDVKGYKVAVGNPGTNQQGGWYSARTSDIIVTWENGVYPSEADLAGLFVGGHADFDWRFNAVLIHSQALDPVAVRMMKKYSAWLYITDDPYSGGASNPWDSLPPYLDELYGLLAEDHPPSITLAPPTGKRAFISAAAGVDTNHDLVVQPKGTGALLADLPDNAASGGNDRGANAVDLQTSRTSASHVASGAYAAVGGGQSNRATGDYATVPGGSTNTASGNNSFATGVFCAASGTYAFTAGYFNTASGSSAVCFGAQSTASGSASFCAGEQNIASGNATWIPGGYAGLTRGIYGKGVWASGNAPGPVNGAAQAGEQVLRRYTGGSASPFVLTSDNAAPSAINQVILPNNSCFFAQIMTTARHFYMSATQDVRMWRHSALIKRVGNAASTVLLWSNLDAAFNEAAAASWTLTLSADTVNGGLQITGTGESGKEIAFVSRVMLVENAW